MIPLLVAAAVSAGCGDLAVIGRAEHLHAVRVGSELLEDNDQLWTFDIRVDRVVLGRYPARSLKARRVTTAAPDEAAEQLFLLRMRSDGAYDVLFATSEGDLLAIAPRTLPNAC